MTKVSVYKKTMLGSDFIGIFHSITDASKYTGVHKSQISRCIKQVKSHLSGKGYFFYPYVPEK